MNLKNDLFKTTEVVFIDIPILIDYAAETAAYVQTNGLRASFQIAIASAISVSFREQ